MVCKLVLAAFVLNAFNAFAQKPTPPQVSADGAVTFRYVDKSATKVEVVVEGSATPLPLMRGEDGVWTVTTPAMKPEFYGYIFKVDGVPKLDPNNAAYKPNLVSLSNEMLVPGSTPMPWELTAIPHGRVDEHRYTTHVVMHLPADQNAYVVYTPPGYDPKLKGGYPVLYLLHGWSDSEDGWTAVGRAQFIMDSMIAEGKAAPMIVVMPMGYGDFDFVRTGHGVWQDPIKIDANVSLFSQALETEIMPMAEREYNVAKGRENHAIAGLSMGGLESLYIGLSHTDQFAYVAGFSSAIHQRKFDEHLPKIDAKKANLKLLWVACGTEDSLIEPNRDFVVWAKGKGLPVTAIETPGVHSWLVWRDNLLHLAPLLFRAK